MAITYTQTYPGGIVDDNANTPCNSTWAQNVDDAVERLYQLGNAAGELPYYSAADTLERLAAGTATQLLHGGTTPSWSQIVSADITDGTIVNGDINASAAIDLSKLAQVAWTTYAPAWTSTGTAPAVGDGTLTGRYIRVGNLISFFIKLTAGASTTFGTGTYSWSLPFGAKVGSGEPLAGSGRVIDSGATGYTGFVGRGAAADTARIIFADDVGSGGDSPASATLPIAAPGSTDVWLLSGLYEAA